MADVDFLFTLAELSAVLAGFSALILTVDTRTKEGFSRFVLEQVIRRGIYLAGLCLLPPLLLRFEFDERICWSVSSLALSLIFFPGLYTSLRRRLTTGGYLSASAYYSRWVVLCGVTIASTINVYFGRNDIYLLAVSVSLAVTAMLLIDFVQMVTGSDT